MTTARSLSELVRAHRTALDLTLEGLAERSGVSDRTISDIERGVSAAPRRSTVVALADALTTDIVSRTELLSAARSGKITAPTRSPRDEMEPHRLRDFRGREEELALIDTLLSERMTSDARAPLVVLSGAPGVGKSTIAIEIAHRLADNIRPRLFADLGGLDDTPPDALQVVQALLRQLAGETEEPRTLADARAAWVTATNEAPVIVVLDDAASESQVRPVLAADSRTTILVTSRRTLAGLERARHLYLRVLPRQTSRLLLQAIIPEDQQRPGDLDELAQLCGDLPLALRVASLRIASQPSWTVETYARRLRAEGRRLDTLVAGDIGVKATFSTSYRSLPREMQDLFRHLSLLHGSTFGAAMAGSTLALSEDRALDLLDDLADLGLVEMLRGERYRVHDLLRLYADERLHAEQSEEVTAGARRRLARWTLASAANAGRWFAPEPGVQKASGLVFESAADARDWLTSEVDYWYAEFRRAADEGRHVDVVDVVPSIGWFGDRWFRWGHWHEFFAIAASSAASLGDPAAEVEALNNLAYMQIFERSEPQLAAVAAERALEIAVATGNRSQEAWALSHISSAHEHQGDSTSALEYARRSIAIFVSLGDLEGELQPANTIARGLIESEPESALIEFDRIIEITKDASAHLSDDFRYGSRLNALTLKTRALLVLGRYGDAFTQSNAVLEFDDHPEFVDEFDRSRALRNRGFARIGLGDSVGARRDLEAALALAGSQRPEWWAAGIADALLSLQTDVSNFQEKDSGSVALASE